ncbi:exosortase family protein XrtF [Psychroflexus planctonicus]|uniref:exosortase family protein XrtF n=1 Tax=Psychroflexus planctonicus TaxID=1526575 RepID=UPI0016675F31|nr:exosortase family protein XrtF [Psychroflexus planctonicus]
MNFTFIQKNKAVVKFLLIFFGSYLILAAGYKLYLHLGSSETYFPDYITHLVAVQTESVLQALGYETFSMAYEKNASVRIGIKDQFVVQVIEGCNAVSVIILFLSFILAFFSGWKKTLLFIFGGSVLIYTLNVLRIALITIGIYHYPQYTDLLHEILFPLFIYGVVFLLWIIWVNRYQKPKTLKDE